MERMLDKKKPKYLNNITVVSYKHYQDNIGTFPAQLDIMLPVRSICQHEDVDNGYNNHLSISLSNFLYKC